MREWQRMIWELSPMRFWLISANVWNMKNKVRIAILKSAADDRLASQYVLSDFHACSLRQPGRVFISDGENKPEGLYKYVWLSLKEQVRTLSEGYPLQTSGTWMKDDDKGVFSCVDCWPSSNHYADWKNRLNSAKLNPVLKTAVRFLFWRAFPGHLPMNEKCQDFLLAFFIFHL